MNGLTLYGFVSVSLMLLFYALEAKSPLFVLLFAVSCAMSWVYGFLQGACPFGLVEGIWTFVALKRWRKLAAVTMMKEEIYHGGTETLRKRE